MPLKEFYVDTRTQFIDRKGVRVQRGEWVPTFYLYIMEGTHTQWLVMSDKPSVVFKGALYFTKNRECAIKGEDTFPGPGEYAMVYKKFIVT
jgi:hypothetical protein